MFQLNKDRSVHHDIITVVLLLLLTSICECQKQIFYIRPSDSSHCPGEVNASQCYDLPTLVSEGHLSMLQNTSLLFLPGEHFLQQSLYIRNTEEFWMTPYMQFNDSTAKISITCTNDSQTIYLKNVSFVKVDSISFHSCGVDVITSGALQLRSVYHSDIINSKWYESRSSAIFIQDSNTVISDCQFIGGSCSDCLGGGIYAYGSNMTFSGNNVVTSNRVFVWNGGGLSLTSSNIYVNGNLTVSDNVAELVGGMMAMNCIFATSNNSYLLFRNNMAYTDGGGLFLQNSQCNFHGYVGFFGNNAASNYGGMGAIQYTHCNFSGQVEFSGNSADYGGGMGITQNSTYTFNKQVGFSGNFAAYSGGGVSAIDGSQCTFNGRVEFSGNHAMYSGGGVSVILDSFVIFTDHVNFSGNSVGYEGGGISITNGSQCIFSEYVEFSDNNAVYYGGGMLIRNKAHSIFSGHVEFSNNSAALSGGGVAVNELSQCKFKSTALFSGNIAESSGGSLSVQQKSNVTFLSLVSISNSTAGLEGGAIIVRDECLLEMRNKTVIKDSRASSYGGAISLDYSVLIIEGRSRITSNSAQYGGAIHASSSNLFISDDHYFENNSADFGGGLALSGGSLVHLPNIIVLSEREIFFYPKLNLQFISNHAEENGGAIWVENTPYYTCTGTRCFIVLNILHERVFPKNIEPSTVIAINNTAKAGSYLYGGNIDQNCFAYKEIEDLIIPFSYDPNLSLVSSDPKQICLCKDFTSSQLEPDCSIQVSPTFEAFSGQQFSLPLVGVGQRFGTVPAVILSRTDPPGSSNGSETQSAPGHCSELFYTITSDKPSVELILYPESLCHENSLGVLTVVIKIKPCPPGFILHNETKSCTCDSTLKELDSNIQCDINSQSFSHQHGIWIGYDQLNDGETVIYHPHCPFDYCLQELSNFTFTNTDSQCRYNRSGLICGACNEGYSLSLGGSKCKQCSHVYLLLFIPLALVGVVLVLFLLIFKLTVSIGTINGLMFVANIIGTDPSTFLPPESAIVLRVFIAWLKLDFGIDTCLFDGLDMYIKVWLQFVFPFYIFMLIAVIIIASHHSTLVTKYLGSDPVAVLATLILLAYAKLFHAVLTVMSFTYIKGLDGSSIAVWLYDGNVKYMSGKHIPLVVFALLITFLLLIPYTVILLFAPYLQHYSKNRVLFWINDYRLKSFLHSYYAPLKDKYRSWIGILLVLRLCLLIVFVSNSLGAPSINLLAITTAVILLLCWRVFNGIIYTNWLLDALELFFIMKLGLFSASTLYVLNTNGNQRVLTDTLVSLTFISFVAIIVYHIWKVLTDSSWWKHTLKPKWQKHFNSKNKKDPKVQEDDGEESVKPQIPPKVPTTIVGFRESVLEFT